MEFDSVQVQELVKLIESSGWDHARVETDNLTLVLSKGPASEAGRLFGSAPAAPAAAAAAAPLAPEAPPAPAAPQAAPAPAAGDGAPARSAPSPAVTVPPGAEVVNVVAPSVGTFYQAPKPDAPPFVRPGDHVDPDTTVCILEVMKLMNHVRAGATGTVVEVFVRNNELVEHGQPLMSVAVDPAG